VVPSFGGLHRMSSPFDSTTKSIREILGQAAPIRVPEYQRNYCWDTEQIEQLWSDLLVRWAWVKESGEFEAMNAGFFLGSIVTIPRPLGEPYTLLDGQQRLATITIILAAIRDQLRDLDPRGQNQAELIENTFIKARNPKGIYQLELSKLDAEFFANMIQPSPEPIEPTLRSHKLLLKAKNITKRKLDDCLKNRDPDKRLDILQKLMTQITDLVYLVNVTVTDEAEAETVFEILNARGVELGVSDLLRNFLVNSASEVDRDTIASVWDGLVEDFKGKDLSKLIRHSWMSRYGNLPAKGAFLTIKRYIDNHLINSGQYVSELRTDADAYLTLTDISQMDSRDRERNNLIFGFNALNAKQPLPLLLAISRRCESELKRTIRRVNALTMQYSVLERNPNLLEGVYSEVALEIQNATDPATCSQIVHDALKPYALNMDEFARAFAKWEPTRTSLQRYILWEIEKAKDTKVGLDLDPSTVHVDHIYPQKPTSGSKRMTQMVNRLGNLTLLSAPANTALSNSPFGEKLNAYRDSAFTITNKLANYEVWDEDAITARQASFAELAKKIWDFQ
jgi:hypothetical protein